MSIFGQEVTGKMSEMFTIKPINYLPHMNVYSVGETILRADYEGRPSRPTGTLPLPRTGKVNNDLINDYILNPFKFSCTNYVTKKRIWIEYDKVFGIKGFYLPQLDKLLLDGEFDKLLPIIREPKPDERTPQKSNVWYHTWETYNSMQKHGDDQQCVDYWKLVANQMVLNVRNHISMDCVVDLSYEIPGKNTHWLNILNQPYGVTDTYAYILFSISVKKFFGEPCIWHNIGDPYVISRGYSGFDIYSPSIDVVFRIEKNDVNL